VCRERIPVNFGNPAELPLSAPAETVVRFTESSSAVICSALPIDHRQARRFEKNIRSHALTALL